MTNAELFAPGGRLELTSLGEPGSAPVGSADFDTASHDGMGAIRILNDSLVDVTDPAGAGALFISGELFSGSVDFSDAADAGWHPFDDLPPLAFDHADIVQMAHSRLVAKLDYSTIAFGFMAKTFTLSELQCVYEILLNQSLDKRNFRKRMLSLNLIEETGKLRRNGKHRPAREFRVRHPERVEIIK